MPLQKQPINLNFAQGLDTKTDPNQVPAGKFLALSNSVFGKGGLLQKRNGYSALTSLPDTTSTYITTFNGNLTAISSLLEAYSSGASSWISKGFFKAMQLDTLSLIRNNTNQTQCDAQIASNGLICTVYTDVVPGSTTYKYAVADSVTGQNIVIPTAISPSSGTVNGSPRVFILNGWFVVIYSTSTNHLQYIRINVANPTLTVAAAVDVTTSYTPATTVNWDGVVANNTLFLAWNGNDGGGAIRMTSLSASFTFSTVLAGVVVANTKAATVMSVTADTTTTFTSPVIWATFFDSGSNTGYALAVNTALSSVLTATQWTAAAGTLNVTTVANGGVLTLFYENSNNYSFDASIPTHLTKINQLTYAGVLGTAATLDRSVGLASKAFLIGTSSYVMVTYSSPYQPTYFLVNGDGKVLAKLAYSNSGGYLVLGLPSVTVIDDVASIPYLFKDMITSVNKATNVPSGTQVNGIYAQTGISLANFDFSPTTNLGTSEIGANLNLTGGIVWAYDGYVPVEQNFHLYPDLTLNTDGTYHGLTTSAAGGSLSDQQYYYVATYEWSDNQGNLFRSAPSVPVTITTAGGGTSTNTIKVPTLRLTYKTANPVKIVVYRWSVAQQAYYQVTSITTPTLNDTTADSVTITDTFADATILGNSLLYTTGGVVENIGPPATSAMTLFKSRLFLVDAEDRNLLWFSKQVIEATPVEMSDLFTLFVAPTTSAQGDTGPITALSAMDDKLIIFKKNAIYYLTGTGPDNTGANNDFSDPVFITSTVGCDQPSSIVFMPQGLMFQSDKGIWLLGRDLSTTYIGAAVESFNGATVLSALNIPGTNQVRFTLDSGITLMYDYYYAQWGTFTNVPAISSTLFQDLHTYINSSGQVFQESVGSYLDGSKPVQMSFTTAWLKLSGLQGFQRAYSFYLLGTYLSPHKINLGIAYDYDANVQQVSLISPENFNVNYGEDSFYGSGSPYGGTTSLEQWQVFLQRQRCQAVQITFNEVYDSSFGVPAGAGLTLSGINMLLGFKKPSYPLKASLSVG